MDMDETEEINIDDIVIQSDWCSGTPAHYFPKIDKFLDPVCVRQAPIVGITPE